MHVDEVRRPHTVRKTLAGSTKFANSARNPRILHQHYVTYFDNLLDKMIELVNQGYEIEWAKTENWCTINGKTFNVPKQCYERRIEGIVIEPDDTRPVFNATSKLKESYL